MFEDITSLDSGGGDDGTSRASDGWVGARSSDFQNHVFVSFQEMKYAGVNVFPAIDSHKYVKIADKVIVIVGPIS